MSTQTIKTIPDDNDPKKRFRYDEPMLVVLLVDEMGEWAVYAGPESKGEEEIKKQSEKVPPEVARFLFPNFTGSYRT